MRRNEEIKVCCCLTYIQATSVVEITKIGIIIITNALGIQLENESWSILIKKLAFILELENVGRK